MEDQGTPVETEERKKYSCGVCLHEFANYEELKDHVMEHMPENTCKVCLKSCSSQSKLRDHIRTHTGEKPFPCPVCGRCFSRRRNMDIHMTTHTGQKPFKCETCPKSFTSRQDLESHQRIHTGVKPFVCGVCKLAYFGKKQLILHMKVHMPEKMHKCDICSKVFSTANLLAKHARGHTGEKPFECEVCGKGFAWDYYLKKHMWVHSSEKPHKCNFCGKSYIRKYKLRVHLRTHTRGEDLVCSICHKSHDTAEELNDHMKIHILKHRNAIDTNSESSMSDSNMMVEGDSSDSLFSCERCNEVFTTEADLDLHSAVHEDKQHVCEICSEEFSTMYDLERHEEVHAKNEPFVCQICQKVCLTARGFVIHMKTHVFANSGSCGSNNDTPLQDLNALCEVNVTQCPFICDKCGEGFTSLHDFDSHMTGHLSEIHKCETCSQEFVGESELEQHQHEHVEKKPIICEVCETAYSSEKEFNEHVGTHFCGSSKARDVQKNTLPAACEPSGPSDAHLSEQFLCSTCSKAFNSSSELECHMTACGSSETCSEHVEHLQTASGSDSSGSQTEQVVGIDESLQNLVSHQDSGCGSSEEMEASGMSGDTFQRGFTNKGGSELHSVPTDNESPDEENSTVINNRNSEKLSDIHVPENTSLVEHSNADAVTDTSSATDDVKDVLLKELLPAEGFGCHLGMEELTHGSGMECDNADIERKPFVCNKCCIAFTAERDFFDHVETHIPKNSEVCDTNSGPSLAQSLSVEKLFMCGACNAGFDFHSDLEHHMLKHSSEKLHNNEHAPGGDIKSDRFPQTQDGQVFVCDICSKAYSSKSEFDGHVKGHAPNADNGHGASAARMLPERAENMNSEVESDGKLLKCAKCTEMFSSQQDLELHALEHLREKPHWCGLCTEEFSTKDALEAHLSIHAEKKPYLCDTCDFACCIEKDFSAHKKTHVLGDQSAVGKPKPSSASSSPSPGSAAVEEHFACSDCGESFLSRQDLEHHAAVHVTGKWLKCATCLKDFADEGSLAEHERVHNKKRVVLCPVCQSAFATEKEVEEHMTVHVPGSAIAANSTVHLFLCVPAPTVQLLFMCEVCKAVFSQQKQLEIHMWSHTVLKAYKCDICDSVYPYEHDLIKHKEDEHAKSRPFVCEVCKSSYAEKSDLVEHKKVHLPEGKHTCDVCSKSFKSRQTLNKHIRTHTVVKPFICNVCGKSFSQRSHLCLHMTMHTGQRPYKCKQCQCSFLREKSLELHMEVHKSSRKLYTCQVCRVTYHKEEHLKRHTVWHEKAAIAKKVLGVHSKERTFQRVYACSICRFVYPYEEQLTEHLKSHSNKEVRAGNQKQDHSGPALPDGVENRDTSGGISRDCSKAGSGEACKNLGTTSQVTLSTGTLDTRSTCGHTPAAHNTDTVLQGPVRVQENTCNTLVHASRANTSGNEEVFTNSASFRGECSETLSCNVAKSNKSQLEVLKDGGKTSKEECTPVKKNVCDTCSKTFSSKLKLLWHRWQYAGKRPFTCCLCKSIFTQKGDLKTHLMTHDSEKPFRCSICPKSFISKKNFEEHMLVHTGEKPFSCESCPKAFPSKWSLKLHMKKHKSGTGNQSGSYPSCNGDLLPVDGCNLLPMDEVSSRHLPCCETQSFAGEEVDDDNHLSHSACGETTSDGFTENTANEKGLLTCVTESKSSTDNFGDNLSDVPVGMPEVHSTADKTPAFKTNENIGSENFEDKTCEDLGTGETVSYVQMDTTHTANSSCIDDCANESMQVDMIPQEDISKSFIGPENDELAGRSTHAENESSPDDHVDMLSIHAEHHSSPTEESSCNVQKRGGDSSGTSSLDSEFDSRARLHADGGESDFMSVNDDHEEESIVDDETSVSGHTASFPTGAYLDNELQGIVSDHESLSHDLESERSCSSCITSFSNDGLFTCTACKRIFSQKEDLHTHLVEHSNCKPYRCDHCSESFVCMQVFKAHFSMHRDEGLFSNSIHAKVSASKSSAKSSMQKPESIAEDVNREFNSETRAGDVPGAMYDETSDKVLQVLLGRMEVCTGPESGDDHVGDAQMKVAGVLTGVCTVVTEICDAVSKMSYSQLGDSQERGPAGSVRAPDHHGKVPQSTVDNTTNGADVLACGSGKFICEKEIINGSASDKEGRMHDGSSRPASEERVPYIVHIEKHTLKNVCNICSAAFETGSLLALHMQECTGEKPCPCEFCAGRLSGENLGGEAVTRMHKVLCKCQSSPKAVAARRNFDGKAKITYTENGFACDLCDKVYPNKWILKLHRLKHRFAKNTKPNNFVCSICKLGYPVEEQLRDHMKVHAAEDAEPGDRTVCEGSSVLPEASTQECDHAKTCDVSAVSTGAGNSESLACVNAENGVHGDMEKATCRDDLTSSYTESLINQSDVASSREQVHNNKQNDHEKTRADSKSQDCHAGLGNHEEPGRTKSTITCDVCSKSFISVFKFNQHMRAHTGEKPFTCSSCKKSYTQKSHLSTHMLSHLGKKPHTCGLCQKSFMKRSVLEDHLRAHRGDKPFVCEVCKEAFHSKRVLRVHTLRQHGTEHREHAKEQVRSKHQKPSDHSYICGVCKLGYPNKKQFNGHLKEHVLEDAYVCSVCSARFVSKQALVLHMRTHTGEKPYLCGMCGKSFSQKGHLNVHMMSHKGEKPYKCRQCPKSFIAKRELENHTRSHTGEKPFICEVCGAAYRSRVGLKLHMEIHIIEQGSVYEIQYVNV